MLTVLGNDHERLNALRSAERDTEGVWSSQMVLFLVGFTQVLTWIVENSFLSLDYGKLFSKSFESFRSAIAPLMSSAIQLYRDTRNRATIEDPRIN